MNSTKKSKKNVLFKSYGSEKEGFGHISRCISLRKTLPDDWSGVFVVNINKFLEKFLLKFDIEFTYDFPEQDIDIIIIDQWKKENGLTKKLKKIYNCPIVRLDYYNYENPNVDTIINIFNHSNENPLQSQIINYYEGLKYAIIAPKFYNYQNKLKPVESIDRVLIIMGGADPGLKTCEALDFFSKCSKILHIDIIIGPLSPFEDKIRKKAMQSPHYIKVYKNPSELPQIMANAHLAISGCGTTFFELSFMGIPAILMAQNQKENRFCEFLEKQKLCCFAKNDLTSAWKTMNDIDMRKKFIKRQLITFDGKGILHIQKAIGIL